MAIVGFDLALVEAARQGDRVALEALLRAAQPHIRRYAERRCITHADEATQEALWTVYRKTPTLRSVTAFPACDARLLIARKQRGIRASVKPCRCCGPVVQPYRRQRVCRRVGAELRDLRSLRQDGCCGSRPCEKTNI